jgi:hypothetical protein
MSLLTQCTKQRELDISYLGSFTQKKEQFKQATVRENGISKLLMIGSDATKEVLQTNLYKHIPSVHKLPSSNKLFYIPCPLSSHFVLRNVGSDNHAI